MANINEINENLMFPRIVHFLGRNGHFKSTGLVLFSMRTLEKEEDDTVRIYPITTKGVEGRSFIDIPFESISDLIKVLRKAERMNTVDNPSKENKPIYF